MKGEICWRSAGVAAGLGFLGKNNLLVTNTFGPRVRVGGVLTNYPLPHFKKEDGVDDGSTACKDCSACLDSCPTGALAEFTVNKKKCGDYIFSYGLRRFSGFMDELLGAGEKEREELLKSAVMRELWQNFMTGCYYYCWECQSSCPVGNHRRR
jgi:epoxyqueuosine reductase QueG